MDMSQVDGISKWIRSSEKLPERYEDVLFALNLEHCNGSNKLIFDIGAWNGDTYWIGNERGDNLYGFYEPDCVEFWMDIPEFPSKWISCSESMPSVLDKVMFVSRALPGTDYFIFSAGHWEGMYFWLEESTEDRYGKDEVLYWFPIPDLPIEEL